MIIIKEILYYYLEEEISVSNYYSSKYLITCSSYINL